MSPLLNSEKYIYIFKIENKKGKVGVFTNSFTIYTGYTSQGSLTCSRRSAGFDLTGPADFPEKSKKNPKNA